MNSEQLNRIKDAFRATPLLSMRDIGAALNIDTVTTARIVLQLKHTRVIEESDQRVRGQIGYQLVPMEPHISLKTIRHAKRIKAQFAPKRPTAKRLERAGMSSTEATFFARVCAAI